MPGITATIAYLPHVSPKNNSTSQMRRRVTDLVNAVNNTIGSTELSTGQLGQLQTEVNTLNTNVAALQKSSLQGQKTTATAAGSNTEFAVPHTLGVVPTGAVVLWTSAATEIYQGPTTGTAWTTSNIYLKSTTGGVNLGLFITE